VNCWFAGAVHRQVDPRMTLFVWMRDDFSDGDVQFANWSGLDPQPHGIVSPPKTVVADAVQASMGSLRLMVGIVGENFSS